MTWDDLEGRDKGFYTKYLDKFYLPRRCGKTDAADSLRMKFIACDTSFGEGDGNLTWDDIKYNSENPYLGRICDKAETNDGLRLKFVAYDTMCTYEAAHTPERAVFNGPATILFYHDGKKIVVKKSDEDENDYEKAVMYAMLERIFGRAKLKKIMKKLLADAPKPEEHVSFADTFTKFSKAVSDWARTVANRTESPTDYLHDIQAKITSAVEIPETMLTNDTEKGGYSPDDLRATLYADNEPIMEANSADTTEKSAYSPDDFSMRMKTVLTEAALNGECFFICSKETAYGLAKSIQKIINNYGYMSLSEWFDLIGKSYSPYANEVYCQIGWDSEDIAEITSREVNSDHVRVDLPKAHDISDKVRKMRYPEGLTD